MENSWKDSEPRQAEQVENPTGDSASQNQIHGKSSSTHNSTHQVLVSTKHQENREQSLKPLSQSSLYKGEAFLTLKQSNSKQLLPPHANI